MWKTIQSKNEEAVWWYKQTRRHKRRSNQSCILLLILTRKPSPVVTSKKMLLSNDSIEGFLEPRFLQKETKTNCDCEQKTSRSKKEKKEITCQSHSLWDVLLRLVFCRVMSWVVLPAKFNFLPLSSCVWCCTAMIIVSLKDAKNTNDDECRLSVLQERWLKFLPRQDCSLFFLFLFSFWICHPF